MPIRLDQIPTDTTQEPHAVQTGPPQAPPGLELQSMTLGKTPSIRLAPPKVIQPKLSIQQQAELAAEKAMATDRAKASANIPGAIRDLAVMNRQFNEAFPPVPGQETTPAVQRAIGFSKQIGAKLGIGVTPKQTAILKAMPLASIGLVRMAGALGRVTNVEIQFAEQAVGQQGLTPDERFELTKTLVTQYLARVAPADLTRTVKANPDLPGILNQYGIALPTQATSLAPDEDAIVNRLLGR